MSKNLDCYIKELNDKILSLWKESENSIIAYNNKEKDKKNKKDKQKLIENKIPALIAELPDTCEILFIGLNPSFSIDGIKKLLNDKNIQLRNNLGFSENFADDDIKNYFKYDCNDFKEVNSLKEKQIIEYEKAAHDEYPYFDKFKDLANAYFDKNDTKKWAHIDWLYLRETSSSNVEIYFKSPELKDFFDRQIGITKEIIKKLNPKVILVANALASKIFKERFVLKKLPAVISKDTQEPYSSEIYNFIINNIANYDDDVFEKKDDCFKINKKYNKRIWQDFIADNKFKDEIGTYKIQLNENDNKECIVFFSGMLGGQRALDLDTYKRLKWHLKKIKNEK